MSSVMEISEILDRINRVTGRFEREAVEAAIVRQDEITPELLQILEKLLCALEALECLARSGRVERAVVVLYFRELFNGKLERTRSDLWDCLAGLAVELEAAELLPEIRRAYSSEFPQVNIVRQICLINGTFPGNGTTLQTTLPPQLIDKSRNPIPLEWTAPCPI